MPTNPLAVKMAEEALRALGKEDLLFTHHGDVHARPDAYERLAEFFELYAQQTQASRMPGG